ncbi:MAG: hypothetical protein ACFWT7_00205 [Succiniclasticum sp.]|jgi:hypothetical protein
MKDITEQFIETEPVERQAFFWVGLYYYLTRAALQFPQGERVIRQAVREYGKERSLRRRHIVLSKGLEPNLLSLFTNGDLPGDTRFQNDKERSSLSEEVRHHIVTRCPDAEMWKELGDDETHIGQIYCEEVHHTLYGCFDDGVQVNLCETITHGDPICRFFIYCRKANQHPQHDEPYIPQSWEDTGSDGIKCNFTMFALLYNHLAKNIVEYLGIDVLKKGIKDFAHQRGLRLKELCRRNKRNPGIRALLEDGDLFLDPRCKPDIEYEPGKAIVKVKRCVFAEVQNTHAKLGGIYCSLLYKELLKAYREDLKVEVKASRCSGSEYCCLVFSSDEEKGV